MILPHQNLGQIGVVGDQNGEALPVNAWTNSMNVRFGALGIEKIKEPALRVPTPVEMQIFTTKLYKGRAYVFAASQGGLWAFIPDDVADFYWQVQDYPWNESTKTWADFAALKAGEWKYKEADSGLSKWNFTHWGDTVIFNCYEQIPQMWDWDMENWVDLPKWGIVSTEWDLSKGGDPSFDTELRCQRLLAYKSQLVAIGIKHKDPIDAELDPEDLPEESPVYEKTEYLEKQNVVWVSNVTSDPTYKVPEGEPGGGADAGITGLTAGGPPSWDYISPATLSVQQVVGAGDGRYIAAEPLGEAIIIYTVTSAHALIFTGGQYVVQTRRLFQRGCVGEFSVCEFDDNHFVIGPDQIYIHDGNTAQRIGQDMFDMEFYKRAVNLASATISHDPPNKELWIYFDTNYGRKGCIYNYSTGTFGWHDGEAKKKKPISYSSRGYLPKTGAAWGDMRFNWKETRGAWASQNEFSFTPYHLALAQDGIYQAQAFYATNKDCWVERLSMDFDDLGMNHWINKHLKQYWLQMSGDGVLGVRAGWAESPLEAPEWEKPVWIDTDEDSPLRVDVRTTGRVLSLRFELAEMKYFRWPSGTLNMEAGGAR
ncbi:MAG: hypothetical protein VXA88_09590 [Rhodospirillales bacterium]